MRLGYLSSFACRQLPHVTSRLGCRYATGGSPWLVLAPFKVEQVSLDPYIAVVYAIVSRREARQLKERMRSRLHTPYTPDSNSHTAIDVGGWSFKQYVQAMLAFTSEKKVHLSYCGRSQHELLVSHCLSCF